MRRSRTEPKRLRIAYVIGQLGPGGSERQLIQLLRRLDRDRVDPMVLTGEGWGFILDQVHEMGIPISFLPARLGGLLSTCAASVEMRRFRPHLIHAYGFVGNTWARVAGPISGTPIVITSLRALNNELTPAQRRLDRWLMPRADHIISNSRDAADRVLLAQGVPTSKLTVIPNGVDMALFTPLPDRHASRGRLSLPEGPRVIGMVGSFTPFKRWDLFLDAVALISRTDYITAVCVGDGALRVQLEARVGVLALHEVVRFLGVREDIPEVMAAMDVLVSCSSTEGMSNAVMEAMASARPVVATAVGGTREVVSDDCGILVPSGDVDALANGINRILDDEHLAHAMGAAGRRRIRNHFTIERCVDRTFELYQALLAQKGISLEVVAGKGNASTIGASANG